jgi:hypothetical protein
MGAMRRQSECTSDQRYPASGQTAGGHAIVGEFLVPLKPIGLTFEG